MDLKQIHFGNSKSILKMKDFISFIHNLEEKLSSVKIIHGKLNELMSMVSTTHETIIQELTTIKIILSEQKINEDEIDERKCEWDEEDQQIQSTNSIKKFDSKSVTNLSSNSSSTHPSLYSPSPSSSYQSESTNSLNNQNRPNSSTSKRSSNLKKSDQSSTRARSPKSVTFSLQETTPIIQKEQTIIQSIHKSSTEIENSNQLVRLNSDLMPDLFQQHHHEVTNKLNIGYKLGNALTNVRIHEIESKNGDYLRLLNISNSDDYDLSGHFLQQNIACVPVCRFRFPFNTIIRAGQTVTVWCANGTDIQPQHPHIFLWKEQRRWETGSECVTILAKPSGQAIAWARSSYRINTDQSSSDILFVHSKSNISTINPPSISSNSFKSRSRLSAFNFIGNNKPPFAHSPSSPIHPDHNGTNSNLPNDLRSQISQRGGVSQLLNRPKSSPFASHTGCKQDLISMKFLRNQQTQEHQQTTIQT